MAMRNHVPFELTFNLIDRTPRSLSAPFERIMECLEHAVSNNDGVNRHAVSLLVMC
jgi:hypothetical protein